MAIIYKVKLVLKIIKVLRGLFKLFEILHFLEFKYHHSNKNWEKKKKKEKKENLTLHKIYLKFYVLSLCWVSCKFNSVKLNEDANQYSIIDIPVSLLSSY